MKPNSKIHPVYINFNRRSDTIKEIKQLLYEWSNSNDVLQELTVLQARALLLGFKVKREYKTLRQRLRNKAIVKHFKIPSRLTQDGEFRGLIDALKILSYSPSNTSFKAPSLRDTVDLLDGKTVKLTCKTRLGKVMGSNRLIKLTHV